jgi:hypothetical protein
MIVECINDSGRPADIPLSKWVKRGNAYTVIAAYNDMNGVLLFVLEEIDLTDLNTVYKGFAAYRFRPIEGLDELINELELELTENL